jgi:hypothetical protein
MATWIAGIALLAGLAALAYAWKLSQELETARGRLDRYNRALFDVNDELRALREQTAENHATLWAELLHRTGTPAFDPNMTVRQAQKLHPQAGEVLAGFHLGGCSSCAVEPDETLATVCAQSGAPVEQVIGNLNLLLGPAGNGMQNTGETGVAVPNGAAAHRSPPYTPTPVKLPNMEVDF